MGTAGGVAAAVIGPSLVRVTHDLTMPLYVATYAAILVLHVIVFTIMSFISFPSVTPAASTPSQAEIAVPPRPLLVIASQPRSSRRRWPACWRSARCPSS